MTFWLTTCSNYRLKYTLVLVLIKNELVQIAIIIELHFVVLNFQVISLISNSTHNEKYENNIQLVIESESTGFILIFSRNVLALIIF